MIAKRIIGLQHNTMSRNNNNHSPQNVKNAGTIITPDNTSTMAFNINNDNINNNNGINLNPLVDVVISPPFARRTTGTTTARRSNGENSYSLYVLPPLFRDNEVTTTTSSDHQGGSVVLRILEEVEEILNKDDCHFSSHDGVL